MSFIFVIIIALVRYLQKTMKMTVTAPEWNSRFNIISYVSIGCLVLQILASFMSIPLTFVGYVILAGLLYLIFKKPLFTNARFLFNAIVPYLIVSSLVSVLQLVAKSFYKEWSNTMDNINTAAVIWGIGVWIVTNRQQKQLNKAVAKVQEEEENNKVITAVKAQLEVQVAERTAELTKQKDELQTTLNELKTTQAQLVQSEKMASLGELTAGIAHEIQNPLNFVNNFSEVNSELIAEMKQELEKGNMDEVKAIAEDIEANEQKIVFHGKRADAIVKGMLQHSRSSNGQKELTDINALCDEYLRLSYHGLRAKDKTFNASIKTEFEATLEKINVVSQDIGRVILNLLTNAFYAVADKKKTAGAGFEPTVTVSTKKLGSAVEINVIDNGNGIPQKVLDKIFQPFFTTKPTGQGTGLGLSLSYDIITKGHNGKLKVNTKENEGTTFSIILPVKK